MASSKPTPKGDILIVDDNPVNLDLLSGMLLDRGYRVRVATNGSLDGIYVNTVGGQLVHKHVVGRLVVRHW